MVKNIMVEKTIYALSTPMAKSAIAIIRVSGRHALASLQEITKRLNFTANKATLVNIYDNEEVLDKAIVIYFKAPNSFTGEDLVEYHLHGSIAVIKAMFSLLAKMPYHKMAEAGEFTRKALENNKIDLIAAEGIADLINAETYQQRKQALRELQGEVGGKYQEWYNELISIVALLEATIDFSDQDIPEETFDIAFSKMALLKKTIEKELLMGSKIKKIKSGIKVAILGAPNVGKSSLINYLSKRDVAIVSNIAGTTRDVIEVFLDVGGFPIILSDTAGIRQTEEEIEKEGINRALKKATEADIKIIVIDVATLLPLLQQEGNLFDVKNLEDFNSNILNFIDSDSFLLINKVDLASKENLTKVQHLLDYILKEKGLNIDGFHNSTYYVSIKEQISLEAFEKKLLTKFSEISGVMESPLVLQERHGEALKECLLEINLAMKNQDDVVILAFHLRNALNHLGKILGKVDIEDILGIIFSSFCIGK